MKLLQPALLALAVAPYSSPIAAVETLRRFATVDRPCRVSQAVLASESWLRRWEGCYQTLATTYYLHDSLL